MPPRQPTRPMQPTRPSPARRDDERRASRLRDGPVGRRQGFAARVCAQARARTAHRVRAPLYHAQERRPREPRRTHPRRIRRARAARFLRARMVEPRVSLRRRRRDRRVARGGQRRRRQRLARASSGRARAVSADVRRAYRRRAACARRAPRHARPRDRRRDPRAPRAQRALGRAGRRRAHGDRQFRHARRRRARAGRTARRARAKLTAPATATPGGRRSPSRTRPPFSYFSRFPPHGERFERRTRGDGTIVFEPRRIGTARHGTSRAEQNRAEPSRAEPNRTEPNRTEPNRNEHRPERYKYARRSRPLSRRPRSLTPASPPKASPQKESGPQAASRSRPSAPRPPARRLPHGERVMRGDPREKHAAQPVVVPERGEARHPLAILDQRVMVDRAAGRRRPARPIRPTEMQRRAEPHVDAEHRRVAEHDREHVMAAERDRRRAHADLQIVVAIDHRIRGVVRNRPEHVGREHRPSDHRHRILHGRERHRNPEAERDAEIRLRNREEALHERVGRRDEHRDDGQLLRQPVERQDQQKRHEREADRDRDRLPCADLARRERPLGGALHVAVEIAIGVIVDRAAGRAHQQRAEREDHDERRRRMAVGRDPQRIERRPEQQQAADRLVHPDQPQIEGKTGEHRRERAASPRS
ncbi:hypothetical protein BURPS1710b_3360 [Burkholderia pseudomallei 1710b]|uniref:Uncharacterized protein n=1 Tax=Burkholderia pseudomallei (strain 1710b) TaxID=320372 RepID=Q3JNX3_BURP1|nr:hypothetical protein BURPS1710b_3360 [Burkholderia pseudomallei 1710b]